MLKKAFYILLVIALIFLTILLLSSGGSNRNTTGDVRSERAEEITDRTELQIHFGGGRIENFTYKLTEESTAYSVLIAASEEQSIAIDTQRYDFGVFVKSIDGMESGADIAWVYFVNGESGQVAADQFKLKNGDLVEWKYIKPE